jgi:hypothetical protein
MYFDRDLNWDPVPWRAVVRLRRYFGPRGGMRVHILYVCGHTTDRTASKDEKKDPEGEITQRTGTCYPCWWAAGNGFKPGCGQTHFSLITGGRRV